ncbi:MAG: substrate-binding domain-containing protein [Burkholderiaceae bacterium]|nr:substrate-binding domain-containing protein [Burkholderiaceae bacterium]
MGKAAITGISSMATRRLLAELAAAWEQRSGTAVAIESVGGVDAAKRVQAGEIFDLVVLASDAIERLLASGHVAAGSRIDLVRSDVAVAVKAGAARPDIDSEDALRRAVLGARSVACSTGPSGVALAQLFERWGIADELRSRIVQPPPGVPVGTLVARGEVELGFQQWSELVHVQGIELLGPLPDAVRITTIFSGGVCTASTRPEAARAVLEFMASPDAAEAKRRQGMAPA